MKITLVEEAELKKQNERAKAENYSLSLYLHPGVKLQNEMVQANMEKKQNQNELPVLMDQVKVKVKVDTKTETPKVQNINEVYYNFDIAKREAKRRARWDQSKTGRLVNALADITVALVTKCLTQRIDKCVELRIFKKPILNPTGDFIVGAYRNMSSFAIKEIERRQKKGIELNETIIDDGFIHIIAGELIPGEIGADRDNVATWREFFDIVSQFSFWWRYVLAFHGLFGWRACVNRSVLNVVDSKVLGFVSITISKFV